MLDIASEGIDLTYYMRSDEETLRAEQRIGELDAMIPQEIKDDDHALLASLGLADFPANIDTEATARFRKEDTIEVSIDSFQVVIDDDQQQRLLKAMPASIWNRHWPRSATLNKMRMARNLQEEETAFKVADIIDYPVPETKLIQKDNRPWLAYKFVPNARDYSSFDPAKSSTGEPMYISNPGDLITRPLFNALIGAGGDSAFQSIVDQADGKIYAQDLRAHLYPKDADKAVQEVADKIAYSYQKDSYGHGPVNRGLEGEAEAYAEFIAKLGAITHETAIQALANYMGNQDDRLAAARALETRARALELLYSQGFFTMQNEADNVSS